MKFDVIIIGGGIVGLSTAYQLKLKIPRLKVALLEKEQALALHQTGRNSGVIHSGIYYKPDSLKARTCLQGYKKLLTFAQKYNIPYKICGKVIIASKNKELRALEHLYARALQNGLTEVRKMKIDGIREIEPYVRGVMGLHVPQAGIIDFKKVAEKYAELFTENQGEIFCNEKVRDIKIAGSNKVVIEATSRAFEAKLVINCGGLYADKLAGLNNPDLDIKIIPFRGEYYHLKKEKEYLVKGLIYPVLDPRFPFLGVHFTRLIGGGIHLGPNAVLAFKREGYKFSDFDRKEFWESVRWPGFQKVSMKYWNVGLGEMYRSFSKRAFTRALQKLIPRVTVDDLEPAQSGVRAQACHRRTGLLDDFYIVENPGIINVCNAPSPAATSSVALGDIISDKGIKALGF